MVMVDYFHFIIGFSTSYDNSSLIVQAYAWTINKIQVPFVRVAYKDK